MREIVSCTLEFVVVVVVVVVVIVLRVAQYSTPLMVILDFVVRKLPDTVCDIHYIRKNFFWTRIKLINLCRIMCLCKGLRVRYIYVYAS